jgi:head-tail adaptor
MKLQAPNITLNSMGQKEISYETVTEVWGRLHSTGSSKTLTTDQPTSVDRSEISIRWIGDIKPNYRLVWSNYVYDIEAVLLVHPKQRFMKLLCSRIYLPVFVIGEYGVSVNEGLPITMGTNE